MLHSLKWNNSLIHNRVSMSDTVLVLVLEVFTLEIDAMPYSMAK